MANPLQQLHALGQSFWYDNIRRELLVKGELARMVREDGLRGLTSNPTIFAKAMADTADYDASIRRVWAHSTNEIFLQLMIEDIQGACDVLRPVYEASGGADGYASIEVFPDLARDGAGTIEQARMLWRRVARPNVMVKIPATPECLTAISTALGEGINLNITLMFGFASYQAVVEAYLGALERRAAAQAPLDRLASVASLFVSRVDTKLDPRLGAHAELQGKAGIANAQRMYRHFTQTFQGPRWERLQRQGARPQRLLWASTSTKNPNYPDTLYADALIGPHTVDTMPDQTVAAFRDHGHPADRLSGAMAAYATVVEPVLRDLSAAGIDLEQTALELQNEGVDSFEKSFVELIAGLERKLIQLSFQVEGPAEARATAAAALEALPEDAGARIWAGDASLWSADAGVAAKIGNRLGWLRVAGAMQAKIGEIEAVVAACKAAGYTDAVLLGMGGSSLAPEVFSEIFDSETGLNLHVLDTTDPDQIARVEARVKLPHTLFLVSSKSGGTLEPNSLFAYFWAKLSDGRHYLAITDAGTSLEKLAQAHQFRHVFTNPGDIGGRYSALSYFGLVPAALQGVDLRRLLAGAEAMAASCGPTVAKVQNPGLELGAAMGAWARAGRDKLTFLTHPELKSVGSWLEQLIAESTGKLGHGIVPVEGEPLGPPRVYGADRVFVHIGLDDLGGGSGDAPSAAMQELAKTAPVVRITLRDRYDLGRELFRWEFATAVAGAVLGINPFDEPNVQESKDNTVRVLGQYLQGGAAAAGFTAAPAAEVGGLKLYGPAGVSLAAWLASVQAGDYIAIMAYLERTPTLADGLEEIRTALRNRCRVATTVGFGPRFLHSTGQLHKGGANRGVFLQITGRPRTDLEIPGQKYSFATLLAAQAMGDYESLQQHQRRLLRVDVGGEAEAGLERLLALVRQ